MDINDNTPFLHAMQYTAIKLVSMALNTAMELDIFGIIARAGDNVHLSALEIASLFPQSTPNTYPALERLLRLLTSHGFLTSSKRMKDGTFGGELVYGLGPSSYFLLKESNQGSLAHLHAFLNHKLIENIWWVNEGGQFYNFVSCRDNMKVANFEGGQCKKLNEISFYDSMHENTLMNELFINAMTDMSKLSMSKILDGYKGFEKLSSIVDVGGCTGNTISMIVTKYPFIKGINYDLPHVIQFAPHHPGVEHIAGNMFESIPKAEAIILKDILHNWSDEECVKILKNCYDALPIGGKVIIITLVLPEVPDSSHASRCIANVHYMMMLHFSGRERTIEEYSILCNYSGFTKCDVAFVAYDFWSVLELLK